MTVRIRLSGVSKQYSADASSSLALSGIDLSIEAGEIFGLIGRSGAGKSTLLRMINALERPTAGEVLVDGVNVHELPGAELRGLRQKIGMVFQQFNLWNSRTVFGNIATPLKLAGWDDAAIAQRVAELIDFVGLGGKEFARPRHLSGGQKQRVGIARAIANRPSILLADEATSALDPQTTAEIVDLLRAVNRELGITVVLVTHEMDVMAQLADRVAILSKGVVVESGDIHQILSRPQHEVTRGLVGSYTKATLTDAERDHLREEFAGRHITVIVDPVLLDDPILSRVGRETGVDFVVVQGGVGRVKNQPYGQLSLALHGDNDAIDLFIQRVSDIADVKEW